MSEVSFLEKLNFVIDSAPAMTAIIITLFIAIMSKVGSTKEGFLSIIGSLVTIGFLGFALVLQIKASTNRFFDDLKLHKKISCLEKKIDLLSQSQNIRGVTIESCETLKRLAKADKNELKKEE